MSKAEHVARYLIHLAANEPEANPLTHMQLQKLLYYVQGYHLAFRQRPFFESRIEAWRHGPVVRTVYGIFADYEDRPLPASEGPEAIPLKPDEKAFVASIWEHYKQYSPSALRQMTHAERPWREVWGNRPDDASCSDEISQHLIRSFFEAKARSGMATGISLEDLREAEDDFKRGRGVPLDQALREFDNAL